MLDCLPRLKQLDNVMVNVEQSDDDDDDECGGNTAARSDNTANASHHVLSGTAHRVVHGLG